MKIDNMKIDYKLYIYFTMAQSVTKVSVAPLNCIATLHNNQRWAKLLSLGGRYSYKLLAKRRLPLQVAVSKYLAVKVTSYCFKILGR